MSNPWKLPATAGPTTVLGASSVDDSSRSKAAPSMQDLMDEALALKLYEEECRAFEKELNPEYFANSSAFGSARDRDDGKEIYGADSFAMEAGEDEEQDDEAEVRAQMAKQLALRAASSSRTSQARQKTRPAAGERKTAKFDRDLAIDDLKGSSKGFNALRESQRKVYKGEKNGLGGGRVEAEQFATIEGVLDERTTRILQKMINSGELDEVHGVVRTGKEAHVYHAVGVEEETLRERELAVKIFKTTLNEFSNRHEYVTGDRRFDLHFQKKDQRRQIKSWTEKEYRNLCRAAKCGIRAPAPLVFKEHVLVMEFIGEGGYPAPTLKDLELTVEQQGHIYADILQATRTLFHVGRLVHGDLSEYNILVYKQRTWLIDFGQAVDRSHPEHETFLKRDLHTLHRFFQRGGLLEASDEEVGLLSDEEAFEYITAESTDELLAEYGPLRELLLLKQDAPAMVEEQEEATEEQAEATGEQEEPTASTPEEDISELKQGGSTDLPKQVEQPASQSAAA